ncbi:hypothetical protein Q1695_011041 [Nippostrongylus brasiliensis]|nr:hypothetical protein Q1695_011041 [Nippostrongylus brasiliensis]
MLRRYSSQNLETIPMQTKVLTIGATGKCDVKVNAKGVHPVHASIEQNPSSGSFWLKDHSLAGRTTVNGHCVHGQVELQNGDLVRVGRAQPFVFEKINMPLGSDHRSGSPEKEKSSPMLPILGVKKSLSAKPGVRRPGTAIHRGKRNVGTSTEKRVKQEDEHESRRISPCSSIESNSVTSLSTVSSGLDRTPYKRKSVGNHLLQRVVRLQDELTRKNIEIDELRRQNPSNSSQMAFYPTPARVDPYHLILLKPFLRDMPGSSPYGGKNFELEVYRCFLDVVASKIRSFNNLILRGRQSSYSDVFSAFCNITKEPISRKMMEIERECDIELERKGFSAIQRAHLADLFRNGNREHIP